MRRIGWTALLFLAALGVGCSGADEPAMEGTGGDTATVDSAVESGTRVALPGLFGIMAGLESDMQQIGRGLWTGRFDSIAAGARAIAEHPMVTAQERAKIADVLGEDMARFGGLDARVHDLAVELAEAARAEEMDTILDLEAELRAACVACHMEFRDRLRTALD